MATSFTIVLQLIINALLARFLSVEEYGNYSYLINLFTVSQTIFNFGYYYSICRLISLSEDDKIIKGYYYEGLCIWLKLSILMIFLLYVYALINASNITRNNLMDTLLIIIPLSIVYLLTNYNEQILQGSNHIGLLAISRSCPKFIFAICLVCLLFVKSKLGVLLLISIYLLCCFSVYLWIIYLLHPKKYNRMQLKKNIYNENKRFGFNIYLSSLLSVGSANLMGLLISHFCSNNVTLGFYNIALQVSAPLTLIPAIVSTVLFREFAKNSSIGKKVYLLLLCISISLYFILFFISDYIVFYVFGKDYLAAASLIKILGIGSIMYGMADFFNKYLLAIGKGNTIRNISFLIGISYLSLGFLLIPTYGAEGASYSKIFVGLIYLCIEVICVIKYNRK